MVTYPSGKGRLCKSPIPRFESERYLYNRLLWRLFFFMIKYFISSLEPFRKIFLFDFSFAILVVESFTTGESYE